MKRLIVGLAMALLALPALAQAPGQYPSSSSPGTQSPSSMSRPGATPAPSTTHPTSTTTRRASTPYSGPPININTATKTQLIKLPGIGKARSQAIIDHRPYRSPDDLLNRKVIPAGVYQKIKNNLTVSG